MSKSKAILVLCGGLGTRLRPVWEKPKILAPISDKPFLQLLIEQLQTIDTNVPIYLATGYKSEDIEDFIHETFPEISIIRENTPLGTGGAIIHALNVIKQSNICVLNGDTIYSSADLQNFWMHTGDDNFLFGCTVKDDTTRYGVIDELGSLTITKAPSDRSGSKVYTGISYLIRQKLTFNSNFVGSFESLISTQVLQSNEYQLVNFNDDFLDFGTPESFHWANKWLEKN